MRKRNKRKAWKIAQGKRGWSERTVWDSRRAPWIKATVLVLPVRHPDFPEQAFSLVICRSKGRTPWYEASQRTGLERGTSLAGGLCLCASVADRDDVAL